MKEKCTIKTENKVVKIYINGILHLSFDQESFVAMKAYKESTNWYVIEFHVGAVVVKAEYDNRERWQAILKLIDSL